MKSQGCVTRAVGLNGQIATGTNLSIIGKPPSIRVLTCYAEAAGCQAVVAVLYADPAHVEIVDDH